MGDCSSSTKMDPPFEEDVIVTTIAPSHSFPDPSKAPGCKNDVSQVVLLKNSFHALPSDDEVGAAMDSIKEGPDTNIDIDSVNDSEDYLDDIACGSFDPVSPTSSRQKKTNTKLKHNGRRPKGRHKP